MSQAEQDRAIIEKIAKIFGWTTRHNCVDVLQCNGSTYIDRNGALVANQYHNPMVSHDSCQLLIDEVGRLGLWREYYGALMRHRVIPDSFTYYDAMQIALTATPRQKTLAALEVLEKGRNSNDNTNN